MTLRNLYKVFCDDCGFAADGCERADEAHAQAKKQGFVQWRRTVDVIKPFSPRTLLVKDLCPACHRKMLMQQEKENGPQKT